MCLFHFNPIPIWLSQFWWPLSSNLFISFCYYVVFTHGRRKRRNILTKSDQALCLCLWSVIKWAWHNDFSSALDWKFGQIKRSSRWVDITIVISKFSSFFSGFFFTFRQVSFHCPHHLLPFAVCTLRNVAFFLMLKHFCALSGNKNVQLL